ncbi:hypothetical protein GCM10027037_11860 [Mucilaginibacter koreensis]
MAWNKHLTQLNDALAALLPFKEDVMPILKKAGLNAGQIRFDSKPSNLWFSVIDHADANDKLGALIDVLIEDFPNNGYINSFKENHLYDTGLDIEKTSWHEPPAENNLEKILGRKTTLLPIYFLSEGVKASKCVVRIVVAMDKGANVGTGFLIHGNYIVTNNHVLGNISYASMAVVQFNYEESEALSAVTPINYKLKPSEGFLTSVKHDWTIVKIDGDANKEFGHLVMKPNGLKAEDFVNIIQHPGGGLKQIGVYRNVVTFVDKDIIQYLTDTEPGSSGSPVFNSDWEVVALHNSYGFAKEKIAGKDLLRNQGIHINHVIEGLKQM